MTHTKTPWMAEKFYEFHEPTITALTPDGIDTQTIGHFGSLDDAQRAAACVNALADLPQAALDGGWTRAGLESDNVRLAGEAKVLRDLLALTLEPLNTIEAESTEEGDALHDLTQKIHMALGAPTPILGDTQ